MLGVHIIFISDCNTIISMQSLPQRLEKCSDCSKFKVYCKALKFQPKGCINFKAYDYLKLGKVRNLFIAEAPPPVEPRYFYNNDIPAGTLRRGLFKELGINDYTKKGLETFCEQNFLTDTIKCRLQKGETGQVPREIISNCISRFLKEEIECVKPKNIVLLGDTARRGLGKLEEFSELNELRVKRDCGKIQYIKSYRVILYVYPITRNINAMKEHPLAELL